MTRFTESIRSRLRSIWPSLSPRARAAVLVLLGAGGGAVIVDQTRPHRDPPPIVHDRPDVRPPPVVVDPPQTPPRGDDPSVPPPVGDYPITTTAWSSDWDMHRLKPETVGVAFTALGPTSGVGGMIALADYGGEPHYNYVIRDCSFQTAPGVRRKWDLRCYDAINWTIERSTFKGWHEEHALYLDVPQGITVQDCVFGDDDPNTVDHCGAGIQMTFRKTATYTPDNGGSSDGKLLLVKGTQILRRLEFNYIGNPESPRFPAFTLSLHHAEVDADGLTTGRINSDVLMEDIVLRGGHLNPQSGQWVGIDSPMGVMVQDRPSLTVRRVRLEYPRPARNWGGQFWFVDDVLIEDCHFEAGRVEIRAAKSVTIRNCTGNAKVFIGDGPFGGTMPVTHYSGDITDDVTWTKG